MFTKVTKAIRDVVEKINFEIQVTNVEVLSQVDNKNRFKISYYQDCLLNEGGISYLMERMSIKINTLKYIVKEINIEGKFFILEASNHNHLLDNTLTVIELPRLEFYNGTAEMEDLFIANGHDEIAIIYLKEPFQIIKNGINNANPIIASNLKLYFMLDYSNNWVTQNFYDNNFYNLEILIELFLKELQFNELINYEYTEQEGYKMLQKVKSSLFNRNLSSIELTISVAFKQNCIC